MKTTVDIAEPVLAEAERVAIEEQTTLSSLINEALRKLIASRPEAQKPFALKDKSVDGNGLMPEFQEATWQQLRDEIYRGRGT